MKKLLTLLLCLLMVLTISFDTYAEEDVQPIVQSGSAIIMEAKTGQVLYEKQMHRKQFPASITKIITAILALENGNLSDTITFSDTAVFSIERGSSHLWMVPDEQITLEQGLYGLLINSANDVANGIAELIDGSIEGFAEHMNRKANELGATDTHFVNPHGLHNNEHYTTAYDMALIARDALNYPKFREIIKTLRYEIPPTNKNDTRYLLNQHKMLENPIYYSTYFYDGCEGGKTGYTGEAGHTLVTYAKRNDMELIIVLLDSGSQDMMYTDTTNLLDYGFDHFELHSLTEKDHIVTTLPITGKENESEVNYGNMEVRTENDLYYVFQKPFDFTKVHEQLMLPGELEPPVRKDDVIGNVSYTYENKIVGKTNILASSSYEIISPVYASNIQKKEQQEKITSKLGRLMKMIGLLILLCGGFILLLFLLRYKYRKESIHSDKKSQLKFSKDIK